MNQSQKTKTIPYKSQTNYGCMPFIACCNHQTVSRSDLQQVNTIINTQSSSTRVDAIDYTQKYSTFDHRASTKSHNILSNVNFEQMAPKEISNNEMAASVSSTNHRMTPMIDLPFNRISEITVSQYQRPTPILMQYKQANLQQLQPQRFYSQVNIPKSTEEVFSSNQSQTVNSSICKFAPKHTEDEDGTSPFKGRYQHCQTNEELISDRQAATTPCELVESFDHTAIDNWKDLNVNAGPIFSEDYVSDKLPEIIEGTHEETVSHQTEENS